MNQLLPRLSDNLAGILISYLSFEFIFRMSHYWLKNASNEYKTSTFKKQVSWRLKIVSSAHAIIVVAMCLGIISDQEHINDKTRHFSSYAESVFNITTGYFIQDIIGCIQYFSIQGPDFLAHGIFGLLLIAENYSPIYQYYGGWFLLFELPTIFLNNVFYCDKTGHTGSTFQKINGVLFISAFFLIRVVCGTYQVYNMISGGYALYNHVATFWFWMNAVMAISMQSLNFFWFKAILKHAAKRLRAMESTVDQQQQQQIKRKDSGIKLPGSPTMPKSKLN